MVPEDLLFWIAPMAGTPHDDQNVLCLRHADAMSVPRGWTLDDRREEVPRLFTPRRPRETTATRRPVRQPRPTRSKRAPRPEPVEQLVIDGTGEIERPTLPPDITAVEPVVPVEPAEPVPEPEVRAPLEVAEPVTDEATDMPEAEPWRPSFDEDNNLDGLLEVSSPLLARAFRGRPRG